MNKIKAKIVVPHKEFLPNKGEVKEITITIKDVNRDGDINFEADMPQHVFDRLKNTSEGYKTKEEGGNFRKKVSLSNYKYLLETIQSYCDDAEKSREIEVLDKTKKLFISFNFSNKLSRHNWCGATTGNRINIGFQYFVGFKTITQRVNLMDVDFGSTKSNKKIDFIRYESDFVDLVQGAAGTYKVGSIQPLHYDWKHKEVEQAYTIIDWIQEREDFLKEIEDNFDQLGNKLNAFLGDLSSEKLDHLIDTNQKLLN